MTEMVQAKFGGPLVVFGPAYRAVVGENGNIQGHICRKHFKNLDSATTYAVRKCKREYGRDGWWSVEQICADGSWLTVNGAM